MYSSESVLVLTDHGGYQVLCAQPARLSQKLRSAQPAIRLGKTRTSLCRTKSTPKDVCNPKKPTGAYSGFASLPAD
jgi:hypothetical protein